MKKPGDTLNVPCDWCDRPSSYSMVKRMSSIYLYSCAEHKGKMEAAIEQLNRYKSLGRIK